MTDHMAEHGRDAEWVHKYLEREIAALKELFSERFVALSKALELQAEEYQRRLDTLNHAHEKAVEVQHTYVTAEKYEERVHSETVAREVALERVNEKFDDYVKRYEQRQREVDNALSAYKATAEEQQRTLAEHGRRQSRNIAVATVVLALAVALANYISSL